MRPIWEGENNGSSRAERKEAGFLKQILQLFDNGGFLADFGGDRWNRYRYQPSIQVNLPNLKS